jgi:3-oxoacyl-[acyl-carrier protein] reductase
VGENATAVRAEVADAASVQAMADAAAKFGCIDILVNNAALYGALCGGRFEAIGEAEWDDAMRANVKGIWQCCKAVVPQMRKAGGGSIINMASLATIYGMPFALHYTVSKAAVVGLTRGLARGSVATTFASTALRHRRCLPKAPESSSARSTSALEVIAGGQAIQRNIHPKDVCGAMLWLASEQSAFVTGQTIAVDGGTVMLVASGAPMPASAALRQPALAAPVALHIVV